MPRANFSSYFISKEIRSAKKLIFYGFFDDSSSGLSFYQNFKEKVEKLFFFSTRKSNQNLVFHQHWFGFVKCSKRAKFPSFFQNVSQNHPNTHIPFDIQPWKRAPFFPDESSRKVWNMNENIRTKDTDFSSPSVHSQQTHNYNCTCVAAHAHQCADDKHWNQVRKCANKRKKIALTAWYQLETHRVIWQQLGDSIHKLFANKNRSTKMSVYRIL